MKNIFRKSVIALAVAAFLAVSTNLGGRMYTDKDSVFSAPASGSAAEINLEDAAPVFAPDTAEVAYIIRETDGKIGVFAVGSDTPEYVLNIFVFTLPEATAELLREGIECDTEGLSLLIESFTS